MNEESLIFIRNQLVSDGSCSRRHRLVQDIVDSCQESHCYFMPQVRIWTFKISCIKCMKLHNSLGHSQDNIFTADTQETFSAKVYLALSSPAFLVSFSSIILCVKWRWCAFVCTKTTTRQQRESTLSPFSLCTTNIDFITDIFPALILSYNMTLTPKSSLQWITIDPYSSDSLTSPLQFTIRIEPRKKP